MGIAACILFGLMGALFVESFYAEGRPGHVQRSLAIGVLGAVAGGVVAALAGAGSLAGIYSPGVWVAAFAGALVLLGARSIAERRDDRRTA